MANGELQSLVNFRQPLNSTLRAAPYKLVLSDSPYYVDFRTLVGSDLDGTPFKPYGMYIDNTQGNANLIILFQETQYRVVCKKGEVLNTSYPAADYAIAAITGDGPASIIFVDYSVEPYSSNLTGGSAMAIWGAITGDIAAQTDLQTQFSTKVDKVAGFGLSQNNFTNAQVSKLAGIEAGAQVNTVTSVAGRNGAVTLTKSDVGLPNVDNTSDANKPVSTVQQAALDLKVDKVAGLGLSENSYTNAEKSKLAGIAAGAQINSVTSVAGRTGAVVLAKTDVGLPNVDNTSDANKPVSTAQQSALELKLDVTSPLGIGTIDMRTFGGASPALKVTRQRGTIVAPQPVLNNDAVGQFIFSSLDSGGAVNGNAVLECFATEDQTPTNRGVLVQFAKINTGSSGRSVIQQWNGAGQCVMPFGSQMGAPMRLGNYLLTTLPSAAANNNFIINVTNATGGTKVCQSNGTNWLILNSTMVVF